MEDKKFYTKDDVNALAREHGISHVNMNGEIFTAEDMLRFEKEFIEFKKFVNSKS